MPRVLVLLVASIGAAAIHPVQFAEHTIAMGLKGGYQVVAADMNRDGKPDLIALASGLDELIWFENPGWQRRTIAAGFERMINLAAYDVDGDGIPEILLAHGFANQAKNSLGIVSLLEHRANLGEPWKVSEIDRIPTSHRIRLADFGGSGRKVFVNAPLAGINATAPDYRDHTPLVYYEPKRWVRRMISDENEGVVHGIAVTDWDGDGRDDILTASFSGLHLFKLGMEGRWTRTELAKGDPTAWPKCGSSDVAAGRTGKRQRYLCAIEPWHGHQVSIYTEHRGAWQRQVIDASLDGGHTILTADLNGDGSDEVIAGYRGGDRGVNLYYAADGDGRRWTRVPLDRGGMAASACAAVDLNSDGRLDVVCIGSATANLKWYENLGAGR